MFSGTFALLPCILLMILIASSDSTMGCITEEHEDNCTDEDLWNVEFDESRVREVQRLLPEAEICGTLLVEYLTLSNSTIHLAHGEDLFTIFGNKTRKLWNDYAVGFEVTTKDENNCLYRICAPDMLITEETGPCEVVTRYEEANSGQPMDPNCETLNCNNVNLEPNDCARLYTEFLCRECYTESIRMPRIANGSEIFSTYETLGNTIQSVVVNEGCEVWMEMSSTFRKLPFQVLKPGPTNVLSRIEPTSAVTFKCWNLGGKLFPNSTPGRLTGIVVAATVTVSLAVLLSIGIFLVWRRSSNFKRQLQEQTFPIPKIDLDEFFNGKPILPTTCLNGAETTAAREGHYATIAKVKTLISKETRLAGSAERSTIEIAMSKPYQWKWEIPKRFIKKSQTLLGSGQFGEVFVGVLESEKVENTTQPIAIKEARREEPIKSLLTEIKILSYIGKHPNIVSMLGASVSDLRNGRSCSAWLVLELCENGSLKSFLSLHRPKFELEPEPNSVEAERVNAANQNEASSNELLSTRNLYKWSREIALGMEFLEQKKILHIDLAARNVLMDGALVAKISDFGSARKLYSNPEYWKRTCSDGLTNVPLAFKWMALESLQQLVFTSKSDVWSFGVTIWELFTLGREPYPQFNDYEKLEHNILHGMRLPQPLLAESHIYEYIRRCWDVRPEARPAFTDSQIFFNEQLEALLVDHF